MMFVPDELSADVYNTQVAQHMKENDVLAFAHGFNIHFGLVKPAENIDVVMIAPKGPGHTVNSPRGILRIHQFVVRLSVIFWKGQPAVYYETDLLLTILIKFKS